MKDPGDVLQAVFDAFETKLKARAGFRIPRMRYIHTGQVAYDCEQMVVSAGGIYQGSPGSAAPGYQATTGGIAMFSMDINVLLVRGTPTLDNRGATPPVASLTSAALKATSDAKALSDTFYAAMADESFAGPCDNVYNGGVTFNGPQGGMLASVLAIAVQL